MDAKLLSKIVIGFFAVCLAGTAGLAYYWREFGQAPAQPIAFSHQIHAGKLALACEHCHRYAATAAKPGIPEVKVCMECHLNAAKDRPEIVKLTRYWTDGRPIQWTKVHQTPWHLHFTHKRHLKAGLQCAQCHGEVKAEARVRRVRSLQMGWCVDCHRSRNAPTDCWVCHH